MNVVNDGSLKVDSFDRLCDFLLMFCGSHVPILCHFHYVARCWLKLQVCHILPVFCTPVEGNLIRISPKSLV